MTSGRTKRYNYVRRDFAQAVSGPIKSGAESLLQGVLQVFPKADAKRLEDWLGGLAKRSSAEREFLLFAALICGTRFGIYRPEVNEYLRRLWEWLTWQSRNMDEDLADLVVDALAPRLASELRARKGWRVGPFEAGDKPRGRPPASRAAWVAALVADAYMRDKELKAGDATQKALELAAILTRREMAAPEELRKARRALGNPDLDKVCESLATEFEWAVARDGSMSGDPKPEASAETSEWRRKHAPLANVLKKYGTRPLAERTLRNVRPDLWGSRHGQPASRN